MKTAHLLLIFFPLPLLAQDFAGVWTGHLYTSGTQLPYELVLSQVDNKLTGYSLATFSIGGVENTGIKSMKVKARKGGIAIEDDELIYNDYSTASKKVTLFSTLTLENEDSIQVLQGTFFTRSLDRSSFKGTIRLARKNDYPSTKLVTQLGKMKLLDGLSLVPPGSAKKENVIAAATNTRETLPIDSTPAKIETSTVTRPDRKLQPASLPVYKKTITPIALPIPVSRVVAIEVPRLVAADLATRKTEVIRSIFFRSDSIVLSLYDNGQVDGDTVSVVVNDKIIIARQGLTTTANTTTYYINAGIGDSLRLIMYAENLGKIPPNTGLLIIQDGNDRHQIRFEGDLQRNSAVILRRRQ